MSLQLHLRHQRAHQALHIIEVSLVRSGRYHTCFRNDSCHCSSTSVISARTKPSTSSRSAWSDQVHIIHVFVIIHVIAAPPPSSERAPSPPHHRGQPGRIRQGRHTYLNYVIAAPPSSSERAPSPPHHRGQPGRIR